MLAWLWRSRLTWRATIPLTAVLGLIAVLASTLPGAAGAVVLIAATTFWLVMLARMSDNEARHVAAVAHARGRTPPRRRVGRLLYPWWARAAVGIGVLAATVAAVRAERNGLALLVLLLGAAGSWLVEQAVIALRSRR